MPPNPLSRRGFLLAAAATTALGATGCGLGGGTDDNAVVDGDFASECVDDAGGV